MSLKSLLLKTAEKVDQDYWLNSGGMLFSYSTTMDLFFLEGYKLGLGFFVIKPDLVASGKQEEIFKYVNDHSTKMNRSSIDY